MTSLGDFKGCPHAQEFSKAGIDLNKLPVVDLKDYIADHMGGIKREMVTHPIMRFQDSEGRKGIVISVRFRGELLCTRYRFNPKIKYSSGRIIYHERYTGECWVINSNDDNLFCNILGVLNYIHDNYQDHVGSSISCCDLCPIPGQNFNNDFLVKLLKNQLPYLRVELLTQKEQEEQDQYLKELSALYDALPKKEYDYDD